MFQIFYEFLGSKPKARAARKASKNHSRIFSSERIFKCYFSIESIGFDKRMLRRGISGIWL